MGSRRLNLAPADPRRQRTLYLPGSMRYTIPPGLERRAVPRTPSISERFDRERLLLAALGGAISMLAWLAAGALTHIGKFPNLILPVALGAAAVGALLVLTRLAPIVWVAAALIISFFCIVAFTPFVATALRPKKLVRADVLPKEELDAVIVLSGGITSDSLLMPEPLDRLLSGLALMQRGLGRALVVTEPRRTDDGATAERDQLWVRGLIDRPFEMLVVDSTHTTRDEAVGAWRILRPRGAIRVAVVTSPLHTLRACATFEGVGFKVSCVPALSRSYTVDEPRSAADRLALFREWLYERAGLLEYRQRGWIHQTRAR